jgi:hypothetical protein
MSDHMRMHQILPNDLRFVLMIWNPSRLQNETAELNGTDYALCGGWPVIRCMHPLTCIQIPLKTNASAELCDGAFANFVVGNLEPSMNKLAIDIKALRSKLDLSLKPSFLRETVTSKQDVPGMYMRSSSPNAHHPYHQQSHALAGEHIYISSSAY